MIRVSHIVNTVFSSRTYILTNSNNTDCWLVDCGDLAPLIDFFSSINSGSYSLKGVLLTHVHYDHIYGLPKLMELFPQMMVYTNEFGKIALADDRLNYSKYHNDSIVFKAENIMECDEGTEIELFDGIVTKAYHTPGHNPSCLTYEVENYLFTGDAYIPGVKVVTTLKGGDKKLAAESVGRIKSLAGGKIICPGHEI